MCCYNKHCAACCCTHEYLYKDMSDVPCYAYIFHFPKSIASCSTNKKESAPHRCSVAEPRPEVTIRLEGGCGVGGEETYIEKEHCHIVKDNRSRTCHYSHKVVVVAVLCDPSDDSWQKTTLTHSAYAQRQPHKEKYVLQRLVL